MKLGEMKIDQEALITAVGGQGALRRRLLDMGLTLRGYELTLRIADANEIDVDIVPGKGAAR